MHLDAAWTFRVRSPAYKLKNGIGVGDGIEDVFKAFGQADVGEQGNKKLVTYQAAWPNRKIAKVYLHLVIVDQRVESFAVTIR